MSTMIDQRKKYAVVILLGAIGGGLIVALSTKAIPKMMTQMMKGMMQNMMAHMSENGSKPSEI